MSTEKTWQTESTSSDATEKLAERLGHNLRGGEVIELVSDLGGGKTTKENPQTVVVIEWADVVQHVLPATRIRIHIKSTGDETRQLDFRYPASLGYAMDGIC